MPTKQQTQDRHSVALWVFIAFLVGAAFMSLLFLVHDKGMKSKANSFYGGGGLQDFGSLNHNCFDASLNGAAVQRCLGIPGSAEPDDFAPFQVAPTD